MLRKAWKSEQDPDTKRTLGLALAQVDLDASDAAARLPQCRFWAIRASSPSSPRLERLLEKNEKGEYIEPDAKVRAAADKVLASLWWTETMTRLVGDLMYGLSLGSVLLLAALGLAITFGLMGVINMAHGEMLMLGRLRDVRGAELASSATCPGASTGTSGALPAAFLVCGLRRHAARARRDPVPLRPAARDAARDLGHQPRLIQTVRLSFGAQNVAVRRRAGCPAASRS